VANLESTNSREAPLLCEMSNFFGACQPQDGDLSQTNVAVGEVKSWVLAVEVENLQNFT
jgi:hypothetical protein